MAKWVNIFLRFLEPPNGARLESLNEQLRRLDHEAPTFRDGECQEGEVVDEGAARKYTWRQPLITKKQFVALLEARNFKCAYLWCSQQIDDPEDDEPETLGDELRYCAIESMKVTHGTDHPRLQHVVDLLDVMSDEELDEVAEALSSLSEAREARKLEIEALMTTMRTT